MCFKNRAYIYYIYRIKIVYTFKFGTLKHVFFYSAAVHNRNIAWCNFVVNLEADSGRSHERLLISSKKNEPIHSIWLQRMETAALSALSRRPFRIIEIWQFYILLKLLRLIYSVEKSLNLKICEEPGLCFRYCR